MKKFIQKGTYNSCGESHDIRCGDILKFQLQTIQVLKGTLFDA